MAGDGRAEESRGAGEETGAGSWCPRGMWRRPTSQGGGRGRRLAVIVVACALATAGCGGERRDRGGAGGQRGAADRGGDAPRADDRPVGDGGGEILHRRFPDVASAVLAVVPAGTRVLGVGELHQRTDRVGGRAALEVFRADLLPALAPTVSDLVLETWVVEKGCTSGQAASQKVEAAMRRPAETGDQLSRQIAAARLAGIKVHAMRLTCAELAEVGGGAGDVQIETMLDLVTRELGRVAASAVAYRSRPPAPGQPPPRPLVVLYGGAMHNDRFPYDSVARWSYAAELDRVTGGRYVELDLYPPEAAAADRFVTGEPWAPLLAAAGPEHVVVYQRGERSFVVILPTSSDRAPSPAPQASP